MDTSRFDVDDHGVARLQTSKGVLMMDADDLQYLSPGELVIIASKGYHPYAKLRNPQTRKLESVARKITAAPYGMVVDHINHNTLDNRRCNLRVCTRSDNARNNIGHKKRKAAFKGVYYHHAKKYNPNCTEARPWRAYTRVHGKRIWLGYFATEADAAMAYNRYATKAFGEFAHLNDTGVYKVLPAAKTPNPLWAKC